MPSETEMAVNENLSSTLEDFGRFSPAETPDPDADIADDGSETAYGEENAGA